MPPGSSARVSRGRGAVGPKRPEASDNMRNMAVHRIVRRHEAENNVKQFQYITMGYGGRGEIRTHGGFNPTAVFKTAALNHSATLPSLWNHTSPPGVSGRQSSLATVLQPDVSRPSLWPLEWRRQPSRPRPPLSRRGRIAASLPKGAPKNRGVTSWPHR
jgi:hypothetical protein